MLCSRCSSPVTPIVAVDIDGTLGDYHGHFLRFAERYLDRHQRPERLRYDCSISFGEWFCSAYDTDITTFRNIKLAYRQGGMKRTMPGIEGMCQMADALRHLGVELWITTTRPYLRLDGIDPDTREWLRRHHVRYDGLLYDEDKYEKLAEYVDPARVVAVIDDQPDQYDAAESYFGELTPILFKGSGYNFGVSRKHEAHRADEAWMMILQRLHKWQAGNPSAPAAGILQPARQGNES